MKMNWGKFLGPIFVKSYDEFIIINSLKRSYDEFVMIL